MAIGALGALGLGMMGGGAISNTLGGIFGKKQERNSIQDAMKEYRAYLDQGRHQYLDDPSTKAIRTRLQDFAMNDRGFGGDVLKSMRGGVQEDYGRALSDMAPQIKEASVVPGAGYAPGRGSRTARMLGENLAVRKAEANRDITTKNAMQAQNNMRYAISALPSVMPGFTQQPMMDPSIFQGLHYPDMSASYALGSIGNTLMQSPMALYYGSRI